MRTTCLHCDAPLITWSHWRLCPVHSKEFLDSLRLVPEDDPVVKMHHERELFRRNQGKVA
jgi:hypothetical protein